MFSIRMYVLPDPNSLAYDFLKYPTLASDDYAAIVGDD